MDRGYAWNFDVLCVLVCLESFSDCLILGSFVLSI